MLISSWGKKEFFSLNSIFLLTLTATLPTTEPKKDKMKTKLADEKLQSSLCSPQ